VEKEQDLVNSLQNMVVVIDESNENNSDEGKKVINIYVRCVSKTGPKDILAYFL